MENTNENPVVEEAVVETPAVEETPVVEAPAVEETKAEPTPEEPKQQSVNAPAYQAKVEEVPALGAVSNGVMGTTSVARPEPRLPENVKLENSEDKVAIHSTKNVAWQGVGKVSRGYNIVAKSIADQWLTRPHVRLATPEEIKKAFG
jgi:hypothetical protein